MTGIDSIDDVATLIRSDLVGDDGDRSARRLVIGIAGAPGAGKSVLADALSRSLRDPAWPFESVAVLPMDGFHLPQAELVRLGRRDRMGALDTFDVDGFVAVLEAVRRANGSVTAPGFDRTVEEPVPDAVVIPADVRVVLVEGNYLLHDRDGWERVRPLLDRVYFLAPDDAVRRRRLIARHIAFGKTPDEAEAWVARSDDVNAALVAATAVRADVVIASPSTSSPMALRHREDRTEDVLGHAAREGDGDDDSPARGQRHTGGG